MHFSNVVSGLALLAGSVSAHPGHDITEEALQRREFLKTVKRADLSVCSEKLKARGMQDRQQERRAAAIEAARAKRGIHHKRDYDSVLATNHNLTSSGYTPDTSEEVLYATATCVLTPEVTTGPYYVGGESIRSDLREDQAGVDTILDYQVIDVNTCEPVSDVYLEMWQANATGVYSGTANQAGLGSTWLRGIQQTDSEGVVQFQSIFPGHYTGRSIHIHIMVHTNVTLYANNTLGNDVYSSHIGQTFFDQDLITLVEETSPYTTNTQELSTNEEDGILREETVTDGVDPFYQYVMLGDDVTDGIFAWISFGINSTISDAISPAAFLYESGGVTNENGGEGGGPSQGGGPGEDN
ncbi:aromatic compound dioxygenase [Xylariomycetidae sp. FL2044]|nr:aromatic compound dioxygenase [Xylariomycetidae sp. FL2044]